MPQSNNHHNVNHAGNRGAAFNPDSTMSKPAERK